MTCKTCNDDRREETCGVEEVGDECRCCGMIILAKADTKENDAISEE